MATNRKPNRLSAEKSPYLLQHAHNPVDWHLWGEEAFDKAKRDDKTAFLSIGYGTCHACHVMERESFADEEVAELLNRAFVAILVDREERPDLDHLFMAVCQAMTGQGGWPLTLLLTPDKKPFFAGTYFPKERQMGRYGLMDILGQMAVRWRDDIGDVLVIGGQVMEQLNEPMLARQPGEWDISLAGQAYDRLERLFDQVNGGFGGAPKFPNPHQLSFLMAYSRRFDEPLAQYMAEMTLAGMARGGIHDHIGFGFARYSADAEWRVPHFEKMLYDNALLAMAYLEACQLTNQPVYRTTAERIFAYVPREMTDAEGGFYAAEDADSEGEEGRYYVWSPEEIIDAAGVGPGERYWRVYNVTDAGNFHGASVPNLIEADLDRLAAEFDMAPDALATSSSARERCSSRRAESASRPSRTIKFACEATASSADELARLLHG
ncbi:thioredoxin domain-containing protein [Paenibacillus glycinis]|uniref:DUF255 domain-containing protein n=1 Tax=Paenibacillus glycinis TaxID=2697035 RepID=A0ABW9XLQ9_9BACL|nr:thioredoxin domain-containing protein [Paenibacillus glycinis]NBD23522.1 DUF255 domain-containing protein [Paenibacillus glycinis]